jgi:hypothetical protein
MSQTRPERLERSTSRFAGVTRVGLRVIVIAGFAGTAWALSASAAEAAPDTNNVTSATDASTAPLTSSVTSLVSDLGGGALHTLLGTSQSAGTSSSGAITDTVLTPLDNVLTTTTKPLLRTGSGVLAEVLAPTNTVLTHHGTVADTGSAPRHSASAPPVRHAPDVVLGAATNQVAAPKATNQVAAARSGGPEDVARNDANGVGSQDLVRIVSGLVAPLGLDQLMRPTLEALQPMIGIADPVLEPLIRVLSPVTDVVSDVTAPVFDSLGALTRPVTEIVMRSTDGQLTAVLASLVAGQPVAGSPIPSAITAAQQELTMLGQTPVRVASGLPGQQASALTGSRATPAHSRVHAAGVDRQNAPASPVPSQAPPAAVLGGISTTGSGSHEGNGGSAVVPTPIVNGSVAQHRLLTATGIATRRQITESPTVSPD